MRTSSNYSFKLPEGTDNVKRQDLVDNFESIDVKMKTIEKTGIPYGGITTGVANTYAIATPTITTLAPGDPISLKFNIASTGASTLNWCGLGAKGIKKPNGLDATNLKTGIYTLRYDGTNFILQGEGASGNATASDLLPGKTASTDLGDINGAMPTKVAATYTPSTLAQTISALQYLLGPQTIAGDTNLASANIKSGVNIFGVAGKASVVETSDANLDASYMLSGATGYANGAKIAGNIPNYNGAWQYATSVMLGTNRIHMYPPRGFYDTASGIYADSADFVAGNIVSSKSIFGLAGSASIASLGGRRYMTGSSVAPSGTSITGSLSLLPSIIIANCSNGKKYFYYPTYSINMNLGSASINYTSFSAVSATSFTLSVSGTNGMTVDWIAIE